MRKRKGKIQTIRFPDDVKKPLKEVATRTGWSFNATCANIARLGLAALFEDNRRHRQLYEHVIKASQAHEIRRLAEEQIKKLNSGPVKTKSKKPKKQKTATVAPAGDVTHTSPV